MRDARRDRARDRRGAGRSRQRLDRRPALRGSRVACAPSRAGWSGRATRSLLRSTARARRARAQRRGRSGRARLPGGARVRRAGRRVGAWRTSRPPMVRDSSDGTVDDRSEARRQRVRAATCTCPERASRHLRVALPRERRRAPPRRRGIPARRRPRSQYEFFGNVARGERRGLHPRYLHGEQCTGPPVGVGGGHGWHCSARTGRSRSIAPASRSSRSCSRTGSSSPGPTHVAQTLAPGGLPIPSSVWRFDGLELDDDRRSRREPALRPGPLPARNRATATLPRAPVRGPAPVPGHSAVAGVPGARRTEPDPRARAARGRRPRERRKRVIPLSRRAASAPRRSSRARSASFLRARRAARARADARRLRARSGAAPTISSSRPVARESDLPRRTVRHARSSQRDWARVRAAPPEQRELTAHEWRAELGRVADPGGRRRQRVHRGAPHRDRAHPGESRRPRAPARPAPLHALLDPRRRHHGRGAAADGMRRRGPRFPALVRAPPGGRRKRPVLRRSKRARLAGRARQPRAARVRDRRALPLDPGPRIPGRAVADGRAGRGLHRGPAQPASLRPSSRPRASGPATASCRSRSATRAIWRIRCTRTGTTSGRCAVSPTRRISRGARLGRAARRGFARCTTRCASRSRLDRDHDRAAAARLRAGLGRVGGLRPDGHRHGDHHDRRRRAPAGGARSPAPSTSTSRASARRRGEIGLGELHALRDPHHRRAGAPRPARRGARAARLLARRSAPASLEPMARDRRGAIRRRPAISATCRTPGSPRSTCSRSSAVRVRVPDRAVTGPRRGRPRAWLADGEPVVVENLPTYYGTLGYTLAREGESRLRLSVSAGLEPPPGGIVVRPPLRGPVRRAWVDGREHARFDATSVTLERAPATLVIEC